MAGLWNFPALISLHPFQTIEILWLKCWKQAKCNFELCWLILQGVSAKVVSGNIPDVVLSVTIKDANAVAICACVTELMIWNAKFL